MYYFFFQRTFTFSKLLFLNIHTGVYNRVLTFTAIIHTYNARCFVTWNIFVTGHFGVPSPFRWCTSMYAMAHGRGERKTNIKYTVNIYLIIFENFSPLLDLSIRLFALTRQWYHIIHKTVDNLWTYYVESWDTSKYILYILYMRGLPVYIRCWIH